MLLTRADIDRSRNLEFEVYVDETYAALCQREDTDHNVQITIEDRGPKVSWGRISLTG